MKRIFLAGGGNEKDSFYLDKKFASVIEPDKNLVYIPVAMSNKSYKKCFEWFLSVFSNLGIREDKIVMLTNLKKIGKDLIKDISGVYIGGGDVNKLIAELKESGFDKYIKDYVKNGKPVYGGSAGAIILGNNLKTASELKADIKLTRGFNLINDYSIYPHYDPNKHDLNQIYSKCKTPIIAIPECSGAYIENNILNVIGTEEIEIIDKKRDKHKVLPKQNFILY